MINKIESIKKLPRTGLYLLVTAAETITVTEDIIVAKGLVKGKELSDSDWEAIKKEDGKNKLLLKVYRYLSFRMRSEAEIEDYLISTADMKTTEELIAILKEKRLIDDEMLAAALRESAIANLKGPGVFMRKVKERKLKVDLNDYPYDRKTEEELISMATERFLVRKKELPIRKQKEQLTQKLLRDGFTPSLVFEKVGKTVFIDRSEALLERETERLLKKYAHLDVKERKEKVTAILIAKGFAYRDIMMQIKEKDETV